MQTYAAIFAIAVFTGFAFGLFLSLFMGERATPPDPTPPAAFVPALAPPYDLEGAEARMMRAAQALARSGVSPGAAVLTVIALELLAVGAFKRP